MMIYIFNKFWNKKGKEKDKQDHKLKYFCRIIFLENNNNKTNVYTILEYYIMCVVYIQYYQDLTLVSARHLEKPICRQFLRIE